MHLAFLNPQGNFDPADSYWTEHPDFGGQLVYVKNVALALAALGHRVDIVTRRIDDPDWPEFSAIADAYPGGVRILRIDCGDDGRFLRKEDLWPYLGRDWVPGMIAHYRAEGSMPDAATGHYGDGGLAAALLRNLAGIPYTFTGHSLGAQKFDKLLAAGSTVDALDARYRFARRIEAERIAMNHAGAIITSTAQERFEQYGHPAYTGAVETDDDDRFSIVPPGVALDIFGADVSHAGETETRRLVEARLARDLDPGRTSLPAVVASSRLDPKKNPVVLVEAFAASTHLQETANLVFITGALDDPLRSDAGAGEMELSVLRDLRRTVIDTGLSGKVAGFGIQGQHGLSSAYRHFARRRSVFALTALYEPFGLAPLEAAAAGLAVVATRNGGPSESLLDGDGEYGVLIDPTDPVDIARGLERALGSEWETLAAAGRRRVLDRYTWDRTAVGYVRAIEQAAAAGGRDLLPIHAYFTDRSPDIRADRLRELSEY
ncbi:MAG TPA: glycosyltransferase [Acidimicrobiia bacterium]|nr:glycosyltransferase [Acidimicrobiia bacterium]